MLNIQEIINSDLTQEDKINAIQYGFLDKDSVLKILKTKFKKQNEIKYFLVEKYGLMLNNLQLNEILEIIKISNEILPSALKYKLIQKTQYKDRKDILETIKK